MDVIINILNKYLKIITYRKRKTPQTIKTLQKVSRLSTVAMTKSGSHKFFAQYLIDDI